jgi:glycosyltransferase involved in cell wall biosynthesis
MFGLGIARRLPPALREPVSQVARFLKEHSPIGPPLDKGRSRKVFSGESVVVAGLFKTRSGLGRGAHLIARSYELQGVPVSRVDLTEALHAPADNPCDGIVLPAEATGIRASDLITVVNPPLYLDALRAFDRGWLQERCLVAHWVWELDVLPPFWRRAAEGCDEIWVASQFVADTVRRDISGFERPVRVVPYPADCDPFPKASDEARRAVRSRLRLEETTFVAGYSFAASSNFARKNPEAAVQAFQSAFPKDGAADAVLILRCLDLSSYQAGAQILRDHAREDSRIQLFHDEGAAIGIADFYAAIDVYLAPFRSEGYGLNLVEAVQLGIPVIATGYGLDLDITSRPGVSTVSYQLIPMEDPQGFYSKAGTPRWAEPNLEEMTQHLRRLYDGKISGRPLLTGR